MSQERESVRPRFGAFSSSYNPEKLSLTLKSVLPLIIFLAGWLKLDISEGEWDQVIAAIGSIGTGIVFLYGLLRRIYLHFSNPN